MYFLGQLRAARYATLEDAENFTDVCFVLEEIGASLVKRPAGDGRLPTGLGDHIETLVKLVSQDLKPTFQEDLNALKDARNDKAHRGVYARNAAAKALAVGTTLEDVMMAGIKTVRGIMVSSVTYATADMTLAKVREIMLASSFSYLPYVQDDGTYWLLSDREVARAWRRNFEGNRAERKWQDFENKYQTPLSELIESESLLLEPAATLGVHDLLSEVDILEKPCLVRGKVGGADNGVEVIVGIVSPFDWL